MNELFVRLRNFRNGPVAYSVHGIHFTVGVWARIPEVIKVGTDTFPLADYLRSLRSDDDTQALFEVTDLAGAKSVEAAERERAEREALAARPTPGSLSLVDRAAIPAGAVAAPEPKRADLPSVVIPNQLRADGEEIISAEEKEDAEASAAEKETEETPEGAPDTTAASSRRAARGARQQAKKDST